MRAKILIVGGGVMGTSIAIHAARRSDALAEPVVLLERERIGAGSSGASGAILRQLYADRILAAMARDSLRDYAAFEGRTGRSIGFTRTGVLTIAGPERPEWRERLRQHAAMLRDLGIEAELVEGKTLRELVSGMRVSKGTVGVWEPDGGFVDPLETMEAFAGLARTYGAVTRLGVEVEQILVEQGRVRGVRTSEGEYSVEQLVVVAGPWTRRLLEPLGVRLPLRIVRPENHFVRMPAKLLEAIEEPDDDRGLGFAMVDPGEKAAEGVDVLAPRGLHPVIVDLEYDFYCRCEPSSRRTRIGRTDYQHDRVLERPEDLEPEVAPDVQRWARETLARRLPEYDEQADAGSLASWYVLTPDALPLVGALREIEGLWVAAGFSGHGFKFAPSIGTGLAQMLFGEPVTAFEPELFDPGRFGEGEARWGGRFGL